MRIRICVAALLTAVTLGANLLAQGVDVTGKWIFDVQTGQGGGTPTVTFKQDGEKLTGHYSSQTFGEVDFIGTVKGNNVTFSFNADAQGTPIDVIYDGTVGKETMKGSVAMAGGQLNGTFTAKKQ